MPLPLLLPLIAIGICVVAYLIRINAVKSYGQPAQHPTVSAHQKSEFLPALPRRFVVLDLETTGLDSHKHEIIEFGAIRANLDSNTHEAFQTLVKPRRKVPLRITEINGISQAMVDADGIELAEALNQFLDFAKDLPIVAFNAEFDMGFLLAAGNKHGHLITNGYTCALRLARRAWPGLPSYKLSELAKQGNLSDEDTHRALGDCKRTLIIFTAAAARIRTNINWAIPKQAHQESERARCQTVHV